MSFPFDVLYTEFSQYGVVVGKTDLKTELHRETISAAGFRFAIVVSRWNHQLTAKLSNGAVEALTSLGCNPNDITVYNVPGAFELPLACMKAAQLGCFDAVIALGIVIRGDTPHFEYVAGQAAAGITQASLSTGVPIMFGVITADTLEQAIARSDDNSENKGREAAFSAVEMADLLRGMNRPAV